MARDSETLFDVDEFLANAGPVRKIVQGDPADCASYLQRGRAKISIASAAAKEATIRLVSGGDFFGEKAMAADPGAAPEPTMERMT